MQLLNINKEASTDLNNTVESSSVESQNIETSECCIQEVSVSDEGNLRNVSNLFLHDSGSNKISLRANAIYARIFQNINKKLTGD